MCLESVAHLLVMFNFSTNFLVYCSVSNQFKAALSKVVRIRKFCLIFCEASVSSPGKLCSLDPFLKRDDVDILFLRLVLDHGSDQIKRSSLTFNQ